MLAHHLDPGCPTDKSQNFINGQRSDAAVDIAVTVLQYCSSPWPVYRSLYTAKPCGLKPKPFFHHAGHSANCGQKFQPPGLETTHAHRTQSSGSHRFSSMQSKSCMDIALLKNLTSQSNCSADTSSSSMQTVNKPVLCFRIRGLVTAQARALCNYVVQQMHWPEQVQICWVKKGHKHPSGRLSKLQSMSRRTFIC